MVDETVLGTELAAHHGVTTRKRLRRLGLTDGTIDGLVRRGRFRLGGNGVLVDVGSVETFEQRVSIACAATGGAATFPTSGALWGFRRVPKTSDIHVTIPWRRRSRPPAGIVIHRSTHLPDCHVVRRPDGIELVAPPRTVFEAAGVVSPPAVESMIEQGIDRGMFIVPTLWRLCEEMVHSARSGSHHLAAILRSRDVWQRPARSDYELRLERAMRARGFPPLVREHPVVIDGGRVVHPDLGLPGDGFFVEVDHLTWNGGRMETAYDRWRDIKVRLSGVHVERVSDVAIDNALDETVEDLWRLWRAWRVRR